MARKKQRGLVPRPNLRGSIIRRSGTGQGFRDIVAIGGPTFTAAANAASGTMAFTFAEPGILDKMILMGGAAVSLVAGADSALAGCYVTSITLNGNGLVSGNVPALIFHERSVISPAFGHSVQPGTSVLSVVALNESGAALEFGVGFSVL